MRDFRDRGVLRAHDVTEHRNRQRNEENTMDLWIRAEGGKAKEQGGFEHEWQRVDAARATAASAVDQNGRRHLSIAHVFSARVPGHGDAHRCEIGRACAAGIDRTIK